MRLQILLACFSGAVALVHPRASPTEASPAFSILVNNTLEVSVERSPSYLRLSKPQSHQEAAAACGALQEQLVSIDESDDVSALLSHHSLSRQGALNSQFWLSGLNGTCYAFSRNTSVRAAPCEKRYPGICTNTAPFQKGVTAPPKHKSITINTAQGKVVGFRDRLAARFQGIPYAQPPVGRLRLQNPQELKTLPVNKSNGAYPALNFKPICPQDMSNNPGVQTGQTISEDCLYLNVYTPEIPATQNTTLPVLVWIHGGSYYYGGSSFPYYLGMNMASRQNMVVVSINYRLGALGWLSDMKNKNTTGSNQAMRDQIMALKWVQDHISAYGGDPNQVTILGHSAGGSSVMSHIQSPASKGLFQHAWVESGNTMDGWQRPPVMEALSNLFLNISGCPDFNCVRFNLTSTKMMDIQDKLFTKAQEIFPRGMVSWIEPFRPYIDGDLILEDWDTAVKSGRFNQVPTVISYNEHDYGLFLQENATFEHTPANFSDSEAYLATFLLGENRTKEVLHTPALGFNTSLANRSNIDNEFVDFTTDIWYRCNSEIYAAAIQTHVENTWELTWEMNIPEFIPGRVCGPGTGRICHGSELGLIFGSALYDNLTIASLDREGFWQKSRQSLDLYAQFVKQGKLVQQNGTVFPRRGGNDTHYVVHWNSTAHAESGGVNWNACATMEQMHLYNRLYYPYPSASTSRG